jgi:ribosomal protein S18 acetylase RimI-like enzyme
MTIRVAAGADAEAVLELWARSRSAAASTPDDAATVGRAVEQGALLVAEEDGVLVGTLIAAWDGWRGNMYRLAVVAERRRRGVARALVAEGEARLHARGARRITALVGREDDVAVALWRAAGYADDAGIARFVKNL